MKNILTEGISPVEFEQKLIIEPSTDKLLQLPLSVNNEIDIYEPNPENTCKHIQIRTISRSATNGSIPPNQFLEIGDFFLAYMINSRHNDLNLIKVLHLESQHYVTIKSDDFPFTSIKLVTDNILIAMKSNSTFYLFKIEINENLVTYVTLMSESIKNICTFSENETFHLHTNGNTICLYSSHHILIGGNQIKLIDDIKLHFEPIIFKPETITQDITHICLSPDDKILILSRMSKCLIIYFRENIKSSFSQIKMIDITYNASPVVALNIIKDKSSRNSLTIAVVFTNKISFIPITSPFSYNYKFNESCHFLTSGNSTVPFTLIDTFNKKLFVFKFSNLEFNLTPSHIICYPLKNNTLNFVIDHKITDNELQIYNINETGMQHLKISTNIPPPIRNPCMYDTTSDTSSLSNILDTPYHLSSPVSKINCPVYEPELIKPKKSPIFRILQRPKSIVNDSLNKPNNASTFSDALAKLDDNPVKRFIKPSKSDMNVTATDTPPVNLVTRESSRNFVDSDFDSRDSSKNTSLSNALDSVFPELKKYFDSVLNNHNNNIIKFINSRFNDINCQQKSVTDLEKLQTIEKRLNCIEENLIQLLRNIEGKNSNSSRSDAEAVKSSLAEFVSNFNKANNANISIVTHDISRMFDSKMDEFLKGNTKSITEGVKREIVGMIESEVASMLDNVNVVFKRGTSAYLASVGAHIDQTFHEYKSEMLSASELKSRLLDDSVSANFDRIVSKIESLAMEAHSNSDYIQDKNGRERGNDSWRHFMLLMCDKKYTDAMIYGISSKNTEMIMTILKMVEPRVLYHSEQSPKIILDFISLITTDIVLSDVSLVTAHLHEAVSFFSISRDSHDESTFLVLNKLRETLKRAKPSSKQDRFRIATVNAAIKAFKD